MARRRQRLYHCAIGAILGTARRTIRLVPGLLPGVVALLWLPLRGHLPNTDVALVLVVAIAGVGYVSGRAGSILGAATAGVAFDVLHTRPYGQFVISHGKDVLTTAFLVVAGLVMGELATSLARYRGSARSEADAFALVSDAAGLIATGSDSRIVVEAISQELTSGLGLLECDFQPGPPPGDVPIVRRDGSIERSSGPASGPPSLVDLPTWSSGSVVGHFRMALGSAVPGRTQLQLAVSLADQAGAALSVGPGPPTRTPPRRLRLLRS